MIDIISKMKNNFNTMEKNESSLNICSANSSAFRHSISLKTILNDRYKLIHPQSKKNLKIYKKVKNEKNNETVKSINSYIINDKKKYCPEKNLKYEIEMYDQKKKISPHREYDEIKRFNINFFQRKKQKNSFSYKPCLIKEKFYNIDKSFSKGLFTPKKSANVTISSYQNMKKSDYTNTSLYSPNEKKKNLIKNISYIYDIAKQENSNFKEEINSVVKYEKSLKNNKKKNKKGKSISISKIRKELNLDKDNSDSIEQDKILKNNFEKTKIYLDKRSQNYLKTIYKQINYEDNKLHKYVNIHHFSINNHINLRKLKQDFKDISNKTIMIKKEFKGINAIEPKDEFENWLKMTKKEISNDINSEEYLNTLIKKKNIFRNIKSIILNKNDKFRKNKSI